MAFMFKEGFFISVHRETMKCFMLGVCECYVAFLFTIPFKLVTGTFAPQF